MTFRSSTHATTPLALAVALAAAWGALGGTPARAQFLPPSFLIDSFESGVGNWAAETVNTIYLNHAQSTTGATRGANSLLLDLYGTHQRNTENPVAGATGWGVSLFVDQSDMTGLYNAFNTVAANPSAYRLELDLTLDATSWADITVPTGPPVATSGGWSFFNFALNVGGQFAQISPVTGNIVNQQGKFKIAIDMDRLANWAPNATDYQILLGAQNRFVPQPGTTPGPPPSGTAAKLYIDNIRFKPKAPLVPTTLFSWETLDNPATPDVNEALEGWSDAGLNAPTEENPGDAYAHLHSVGTKGATHGARALTIDTSIQDPSYVNPLGLPQSYRFHWGSNLVLNGGEENPTAQAQISDIIGKINGAQAIAFDVSFSDPLFEGEFSTAALPSFLGFALHITDDRGTFFQADSTAFDGATIQAMLLDDDPREPATITLPISQFTDQGGTGLGALATAKLKSDSTFLRIGLAVNADGPAVIHLDNFRVITEVSLDADFNNDGVVDHADLAAWRSAYGVNDNGDANEDGVTDGADFLIWQRQLGNDARSALAAGGAVPEPTAGLLAMCMAGALAVARRRGEKGCRPASAKSASDRRDGATVARSIQGASATRRSICSRPDMELKSRDRAHGFTLVELL
ncbi:MAG TPA: hypothetical protein PKC18_04215, partial [Lacipirellulaceae bacterium]|nr:hypothetical protein [Lacipirellulaceae bacterium]